MARKIVERAIIEKHYCTRTQQMQVLWAMQKRKAEALPIFGRWAYLSEYGRI